MKSLIHFIVLLRKNLYFIIRNIFILFLHIKSVYNAQENKPIKDLQILPFHKNKRHRLIDFLIFMHYALRCKGFCKIATAESVLLFNRARKFH